MKKHSIVALLLINLCANAAAADQPIASPTFSTNPMNEKWFYDKSNPYIQANNLLREKQWKDAECAYTLLLGDNTGSPHDQAMARINKASCRMAQRTSSTDWAAIDDVIGIPQEKKLPYDDYLHEGDGKTVLVRTDMVGLGDIAHFLAGAKALREKGYVPVIATRKFFMPAIQSALDYYGIQQFAGNNTKEFDAISTDYQTHLISLLGYCNIEPNYLCPETSIYTASEEALLKCKHIDAIKNPLVYLFLGEEKPGEEPRAVLMGGTFLPHEKSAHGRHLTSEAFNALLQRDPSITIVDCSPKTNRLKVDSDLQSQVLPLPEEREAFDTTIAAAAIMNRCKNMTAMTADNGPGNIFISILDKAARRRAAVIVPNGKEYDMRTERYEQDQDACDYVHVDSCEQYKVGDRYVQQISNCLVYRCVEPSNQTAMVAHAFQEMNN